MVHHHFIISQFYGNIINNIQADDAEAHLPDFHSPAPLSS